jgi:hypothetical protein
MPSAILLFYTSEGFLMAADGRARSQQAVLSETMTKIFPITQPGRHLAYAFAGTVAFTDKDNEDAVLFDFRDEAMKVIESLCTLDHGSLESYTSAVSDQVYSRLVAAKENVRMEPFKETQAYIAYLFIAGYFKNQPGWAVAEFSRYGQTPLLPIVHQKPLAKGYRPLVTYGSPIVAQHVLDMDDPVFAAYRVQKIHAEEQVTIAEAANVASKYIAACKGPEGLKLDAQICVAIGGHIHMAAITTEGFAWLIPPKS